MNVGEDPRSAPSLPAKSGVRRGSAYVRRAWQVGVLAITYYVAARVGLRLALVDKNVTPLWPPTGIAVVALLLFGRRLWPGVALGAFFVNLPISAGPLAAAATAAGNTLAPLVAAALLDRVGFHRELDRQRDAVAIVFLGALLSMTISASIGALTLLASGAIPSSQLPTAWAVWWAGDAMGVLVVAPFLLSLRLPRNVPFSWVRLSEGAALFGSIVLSLWVVRTQSSLLFLEIPLIGWAAWRFQLRGAAPAALVVTGLATWASVHALGPFSQRLLWQRMFTLQAFNATVAFSSFVFAAVVTERLRAKAALEEALAVERASAYRLRELDEMRSRFLSAASHELKTPITISRGHLEVLEPAAGEREMRDAITLVLDELDRMSRILNDLMALVRREDAEFLRLEDVDLTRLISDVAAKAEPILGQRLCVRTLTRQAITQADPQRLTQALLNMIQNASMHAPSASRVELGLWPEPARWRLDVADDGDGLALGAEEKIFEPFQKDPYSAGSGLGLAIVRAVAEAHGGTAGVDSQPGRGARFWIGLPR